MKPNYKKIFNATNPYQVGVIEICYIVSQEYTVRFSY